MRALVAYETRHSDVVGVQLLLLSLARHALDEQGRPHRVLLCFPDAPAELLDWLPTLPHVDLFDAPPGLLGGWNMKPALMTALLEAGFEEAVFIDTDIVLTGPLERVVPTGLQPETLLVAEEYAYGQRNGGFYRTDAWGMPRGTRRPFTLNTCVLRVTGHHRRLLEHWQAWSATAEFQAAQAEPWDRRPLHMVGGQDVLTALAGSAAFADLPVHFARRGRAIAQCFMEDGCSTLERLASLVRGGPAMVHAQGGKPWRDHDWAMTYVQLSPYAAAAASYAAHLPGGLPWASPERRRARLLDRLAGGHPLLRGVPHALRREARRAVGGALRAARLKPPPPGLRVRSEPVPSPLGC